MNPANHALPEKLQALLSDHPNPDFDAALSHEAITRSRAFIAGIKAYRHHPALRDVPEAPIIWREGTTKLRDYNAASPDAPIILIIPSLINRFEILDLDFVPSFARTLAAAGLRPLIVDWDEPGKLETNFTLDDYIKRLGTILNEVDDQPIHLLGYCMGGLLALALATLRTDRIKTLTLMATPWDFHQPDASSGALMNEIASIWLDNSETSSGAQSMPVEIIQYLFTLLQPFQSVMKFVEFAALDPDSMEARQFVLLEDWLNDGVPLPMALARSCLKDWYGDNRTAQFQWRVGGKMIDPRKLSMPSYVVVPGRDRIVPPESALPLAKLLPHASLHEPMTGHIGMMASRTASQQVWKPLLHWLGEHR